ncbi:bacillithiol biosynthesis cysteine-adding enzyme BshC [Robiginitalea sp. M366]|uniref:bacillithiol biosynthesis cysteine-adding enzyme BshC n=1 Tax=Robiginitalea aestuariiviva TaxID=3036903 RepID=UPI00240D53E6|nr:bacillithiol biosynthesis cysteine-adding enzyme BshC [Robiginitalea aestuariiviva]MDG1572547.1 bacillithiol biosynthesis cysteine-adding enzyme BshC [Robiginitalea aestuariiviva]
MRAEGIPFTQTGFFSDLITDYLQDSPSLAPYYHRRPDLTAFKEQLREKAGQYPMAHREVLSEVLQEQYRGVDISEATAGHLEVLTSPDTFTVVTGHQLNLFTGPLYFHYKIASAIVLCRQLKEAFPERNFVPVYWMATEDHDFDEISHFNVNGKEFRWNRPSGGAVGRMDTQGLEAVEEALGQELGGGKAARELQELFHEAYLKHPNLSAATRYLANKLFGAYGLVILDADHPKLKALFTPYMQEDLLQNRAHAVVGQTAKNLSEVRDTYPIQVTPREINLFYLDQNGRHRLVREGDTYGVLDTDLRFTREALLETLDQHPERFSPNVILRPLYQEVILPNLCYIGGGGELAYWLELKDFFDASGQAFPILLLRNAALVLSEKQVGKAEKLGVSLQELFLDKNRLINRKIREISNIDIDFTPQREHLQQQFKALYHLADQTDPTFLGAVKAQEVKQLKGLDKLEKRLLKAQKHKLADHVERLSELHHALFPYGNLQERSRNFAEAYLEIGADWPGILLDHFEPLGGEFTLLIYP